MKTALFDLSSGVAGDMILASLIDAGVDFNEIEKELKKLKLDSYRLKSEKVLRSSIQATHFDVILSHKNHLDPIKSSESQHSHADHQHSHDHSHNHHKKNHQHSHNSHHEHHHRGFTDIKLMIENSDLSKNVKEKSILVFKVLGDSEAFVHGVTIDEIHFHEVGAVDSIVDIVGGCIALELAGIEKVYFSEFHFGKGFVNCAHGKMPLPAPATAKICNGYKSTFTNIPGELTTPTGCAMMVALGEQVDTNLSMTIESCGYGAGTRIQKDLLGALRVQIGRLNGYKEEIGLKSVLLIETNIDDMSSEELAFVADKLMKISKQDVWFEPIYMKKNRPAFKLSVLCLEDDLPSVKKILIHETSSFGYRIHSLSKFEGKRSFQSLKTEWGETKIKCFIENGCILKTSPEYEDCKRMAEESGVSLKEIFEKVRYLAHSLIGKKLS